MAKKPASKEKEAPETKASTTKESPKINLTKKPEPPSNATTKMLNWTGICIAILAFAMGIICPPMLNHFQGPAIANGNAKNATKQQQQRRSTTSTSTTGGASSATHSFHLKTTAARTQQYPCTEELLAQFVHDEAVAGFHILCLKYGNDETTAGKQMLHLDVRVGGTERNNVIHREIEAPVTWDAFKAILSDTARLSTAEDFQPWALFTPEGERLFEATAIEDFSSGETIVDVLAKDVGMVLAFSGGQWLWPGVRIGFKRQVSLYSIMPGNPPRTFDQNQTATLETLSLIPLVLSVEGFLSKEECNLIREMAAPSLQYSGVVLMDKDKGRPASDFRTSQTTFLPAKHPTIVDIDYRTASLTRVSRDHQENVQVLRYGEGEHYDSHHDFFDPQFYQSDKNTLRLIRNGNRNRLATVFWYLSDVAKGGETVFPRFNRGQERSHRDCETGLLVKPQEGKVIIFYSLTADGKGDSYSLHGACPPKDGGIKWAANKWVWNEKMSYLPP